MTTTDSLSTTGRPSVPSFIPKLNPLMRRLMGLGMPMGPNVLLTVRGRTSGVPRTFPVGILQADGRRFVQSPFGEVDWVRNLRVSGEAVIIKGGQHERVEAIELAPDAAAVALRAALAPYLTSRLKAAFMGRFFKIRRGSTLADYEAEARRHPMFELRPVAGDQRAG